MWLWLREGRPWWVGLIGALVLVLYGVLPTLQPQSFDFARTYAAYGGLFITDTAAQATPVPSRRRLALGYGLTLLLAVYGGLFSGGYVPMLTAAFKAVATTKVITVASSLVATVIFATRSAVNWPLGVILSGVMSLGATLGAWWTLRLDERWVRRLFVTTALALAVKTLVLDMPWAGLPAGRG